MLSPVLLTPTGITKKPLLGIQRVVLVDRIDIDGNTVDLERLFVKGIEKGVFMNVIAAILQKYVKVAAIMGIATNRVVQTLNLNGNIKLTPRLSMNATSGFDLQAMKITTTQLSATYNLHCFTMSVSWVPTGQWQSYNFLFRANASALADLLRFKKSSSYWDN